MDPYRIVFIGTPEFSVPALQALHDNGYNIAAVVTSRTGQRAGDSML